MRSCIHHSHEMTPSRACLRHASFGWALTIRFAVLALMLLVPLLWPRQSLAQASSPDAACEPAITWAERAEALPPGLLAAIGRVESGRIDPVGAAIRPWPWTINANGIGRMFDTKDSAIKAVRALQAEGVRSIDVGCMQVNLLYHPGAFASLEQAFDPVANATYAARFLRTLFAESGDWSQAAAAYHSRTPDLGASYVQLVLAAWRPGLVASIAWPVAATVPPALAHPFTPPVLLTVSSIETVPGSQATARLLALVSNCGEVPPSGPSQWVASSPACGRSPFATVSLLRRALAAAAR
jgi:hypothetical protein